MKEKNKTIAFLLKGMIIAFAFIGIWVYLNMVPALLETAIVNDVTGMMADVEMTEYYRTYLTNAYYTLIGLFALTGIPCYITLFLVWKMSDTIAQGKAFVMENAKRLTWITRLTLINVVIGSIVLIAFWIILDMYSELFYLMLIACLFAFPFSVTTWALSYMVEKAAQLQIDSDLTI